MNIFNLIKTSLRKHMVFDDETCGFLNKYIFYYKLYYLKSVKIIYYL